MGFTEKLATGKFRARWFDPAGVQRSKSFDRERDAVRWLRNVQSDIDRGVYVDDKASKITFGEWAEHYMAMAEKRLARTSYARDRSYLDNHVLPRWGSVRLGRITRRGDTCLRGLLVQGARSALQAALRAVSSMARVDTDHSTRPDTELQSGPSSTRRHLPFRRSPYSRVRPMLP